MDPSSSRRGFVTNAAATTWATTAAACCWSTAIAHPLPAHASVGSLPEFNDVNAILQGITVKVSDPSQEDAMIAFLKGALDFRVLRKRIRGTVEETWLGYGPEQLSIPRDFVIPVSSPALYGGHASLRLVYDSSRNDVLYRTGDGTPPGNSIAYLQVAVPGYRISQMVQNGGNILDAYGYATVISPAGLPMRCIVGVAPDPIMFVAVNCADVETSATFYRQLGFVERDYPYSRPGNGAGQFEPSQPKGSVYMSPSRNGMGVLLLPPESPSKRGKKNAVVIVPNRAVPSLNLVYTPSSTTGDRADNDVEAPLSSPSSVVDPSGVAITFQPVGEFEVEEKETR